MLRTSLFILISMGLCTFISSHELPGDTYSSHQFDPYNFGYDVEDNYGNKQWRQEQSNKPMEVHGSYGYRDINGIYREVTYVADKNGFRANIKTNEPGTLSTRNSPASTKIESFPPTSIYNSVHQSHPKQVVSHGPSVYKSQIIHQIR